jgi:hypothetical protein
MAALSSALGRGARTTGVHPDRDPCCRGDAKTPVNFFELLADAENFVWLAVFPLWSAKPRSMSVSGRHQQTRRQIN